MSTDAPRVGTFHFSPSTQNSSDTRFGLGTDSVIFSAEKIYFSRSHPTRTQSSLCAPGSQTKKHH